MWRVPIEIQPVSTAVGFQVVIPGVENGAEAVVRCDAVTGYLVYEGICGIGGMQVGFVEEEEIVLLYGILQPPALFRRESAKLVAVAEGIAGGKQVSVSAAKLLNSNEISGIERVMQGRVSTAAAVIGTDFGELLLLVRDTSGCMEGIDICRFRSAATVNLLDVVNDTLIAVSGKGEVALVDLSKESMVPVWLKLSVECHAAMTFSGSAMRVYSKGKYTDYEIDLDKSTLEVSQEVALSGRIVSACASKKVVASLSEQGLLRAEFPTAQGEVVEHQGPYSKLKRGTCIDHQGYLFCLID